METKDSKSPINIFKKLNDYETKPVNIMKSIKKKNTKSKNKQEDNFKKSLEKDINENMPNNIITHNIKCIFNTININKNVNIKVNNKIKYKSRSGKKKKEPPKTDIILSINDIKMKISLKKGIGRPTSCGYNEFIELIFDIFQNNPPYKKNKELQSIISNLLSTMPNMIRGDGKIKVDKKISYNNIKKNIIKERKNYKKIREWYEEISKKIKDCNKIWKKLLEYNKSFVLDLFIEILTGEYKFGTDSDACAEFLISYDENNIIQKIINMKKDKNILKEYIKSNYLYNKNGTIKNPFGIKSSGKNLWCRFC